MKKFLEKFMSAEKVKEIEDEYIKSNPGASGLPTYVGKERLDEVLTKQHTAEASVADLTKQLEGAQKENQKAIDKAVKEASDLAAKHESDALALQKKDFDFTEAIYAAKGKNVKAIKALIDPSKDAAKEIARVQQSDPYLFDAPSDHVPPGTGKAGAGSDGAASKETDAMRQAVGLPTPGSLLTH